jgi:hypothetical protein
MVAGALALSLAAVVPSATARPHGCLVPGEQNTIEIQLKVLDKVVRRGETVRIEVRTYRPAQKNFVGTGVDLPPGLPMEPAPDTPVTVGVLTDNEHIAQNIATKTDSEGKRLVKMKLGYYHHKGPAVIRAHSRIDHFSEQPVGTCVELWEGGYTELRDALKVR